MSTETKLPNTVDINRIIQLLPHRYPILLVDRVIDIELGKRIIAYKNVTINEPFFQGHFPTQPIMPGVLILEGMAQTGGLLAYLTIEEMIGDKLIYFAGIDAVRFRQLVIPGDKLVFDLTVLKHKEKIWKMEAKALVDDRVVAEAQLMAAFT